MLNDLRERWENTIWSRKISIGSGVLGRIGVALLFLGSAHFHLALAWDSTINEMIASGVPFPQLSLWVGMIFSIFATLAYLFGVYGTWGARFLAVYSVFVSLVIYHPFATAVSSDLNVVSRDVGIFVGTVEPKNMNAFILFMKDVAIAGSLLAYASAVEEAGKPKGNAPALVP